MGSFKTHHIYKYELNLIIPRTLLRGFHCHCEHVHFAQCRLREAISLPVIPGEARNPTQSVVLSVCEGSQDNQEILQSLCSFRMTPCIRLLRRISPRNHKKAVCFYDDALKLAAGFSISFFGCKTINSEIKSVLINTKPAIF